MFSISSSFLLLLFLGLSCNTNALRSEIKNSAVGSKILSWDGVIADTQSWRIKQGIDAAFKVWPEMKSYQDNNLDRIWLENKMQVIAPYLGCNSSILNNRKPSKSVEFALLARLIIEEQKLDPSVGKTGKYASKYHPQGKHKSIAIPSTHKTRPLTVGEIQANWGEHLLDATLVQYGVADEHGKKQNPIPLLQQYLLEQQDCTRHMPVLQKETINALVMLQPSSFIIAVPQSELSVVEKTLAQEPSLEGISLQLLVEGSNEFLEMVENDMEFYLGSDLEAIKKLYQHCRQTRSILPQLALASWTTSIEQQNQAIMNPSFNVIAQEDLTECLSPGMPRSQ